MIYLHDIRFGDLSYLCDTFRSCLSNIYMLISHLPTIFIIIVIPVHQVGSAFRSVMLLCPYGKIKKRQRPYVTLIQDWVIL